MGDPDLGLETHVAKVGIQGILRGNRQHVIWRDAVRGARWGLGGSGASRDVQASELASLKDRCIIYIYIYIYIYIICVCKYTYIYIYIYVFQRGKRWDQLSPCSQTIITSAKPAEVLSETIRCLDTSSAVNCSENTMIIIRFRLYSSRLRLGGGVLVGAPASPRWGRHSDRRTRVYQSTGLQHRFNMSAKQVWMSQGFDQSTDRLMTPILSAPTCVGSDTCGN